LSAHRVERHRAADEHQDYSGKTFTLAVVHKRCVVRLEPFAPPDAIKRALASGSSSQAQSSEACTLSFAFDGMPSFGSRETSGLLASLDLYPDTPE
jgi:hypothetical protein